MDDDLIRLCQRHLIQSWLERVEYTDRSVGHQFGFEVIQRGPTTGILAHRWPRQTTTVPFHRIFNYQAPHDTQNDPLLDRLRDAHIDAVIEVLPGIHQAQAENVLHSYGFKPMWRIPWLYLAAARFSYQSSALSAVERVDPADLGPFAALLIAGHGYEGKAAEAWYLFAKYGYAAPHFACFLAKYADQPAAAGVLHLDKTSALVDGAATLPQYRGSGLQKVLLTIRIRAAQERGALHVFSRTGAGSISQANLQKIGMRVLVQSEAWRRI